MTVKDYYRHFGSVTGVIIGIVGGFPLVSEVLREDLAGYAFPPLGPFTTFGRFLCVLFAAVVTFVIYFQKDLSFLKSNAARVRNLSWSVGAAVLFVMGYFSLYYLFVREIPVESKQSSILVSIGYQRTEFAKRELPGEDDWELLRHRGTREEDIRKLWTPASVLIARCALYFSYLFALLLLVRACSLGVLYEASGNAPNP